MTTACPERQTDGRLPAEPDQPAGGPWRWGVLLVLGGLLLLAHGCHGGDHDNELFIRLASLVQWQEP